MLTHSKALWRVEYQSDLTKAQGPVLPVGFVLEARWSNDVRWLGMLFRKRLMPVELDLVDLKTWPELASLEPFMKNMFDEVWNENEEEPLGDGVPPLSSDAYARQFAMHSSLQFVCDEPKITLSDDDAEKSMANLYTRLLSLHGSLSPTLKAPVVEMPRRTKPAPVIRPVRADVEQVLRAA